MSLLTVSIVLLLVAIFALVTYRNYRLKKRLNAELEQLSIVVSETDNGVLICGPNGEIEWANAGLTRLLGYTFAELKQRGKTISELSSNPNIKNVIRESISNKKTSTYEVLNITKNGKELWTQSTLTPILDAEGNIKKLVIIDTNISNRKEIENKLILQNTELELSHKNLLLLSEIGQLIASSLSIEKIVEQSYSSINQIMDADIFCIGIPNSEKNSIDFPGFIEKGKKYNSSYDMNDEARLPVLCYKYRVDIVINDLPNEYGHYIPYLPPPIAGEQPESLIYLPLLIGDKLVGVINVESFRKKAYTSYHISVLKNLAIYVAIAIENARLYESLAEKVDELEQQKIIVEDKNFKITDSISYALRIQQAILPSQQMINNLLPDSFIFFKPKDIVSGDFYWAYSIDEKNILFAAVDCTGHGVPGAFMSIMGYNLLEQIVKEQKIHQPAAILNELSRMIVESLKQTDEVGSLKEGMDIALCKIDYKNMELEYAGAHNPLNIVRNGVLTETKANNRSIGIALANSKPFTNHTITLEKGDCIYIFSDGFADQQGGHLNKKFFAQPLRELLSEIYTQPMKAQEQKLEQVIFEWKGNQDQIDDMLVIGVRV